MKGKKYSLIFGGILLILWNVSTRDGGLMPSPKTVIIALFNLLRNGYNGVPFWHHFGMSMYRLFIALFLAVIIGVPLGLLSGYYKPFRNMVEPFINFYKPLPPLSYYVLIIMWLGIDEKSKVMLLFLAAFAPIYISVSSSVINVRQDYILSAKSLGANNWNVFKTVIIPASLPGIMMGVRTAFGVAYTTLASSEMIAATSGLGWLVMDAYNYLKTDVVIATIFIMGLTGVLMDWLIKKFNEKFIFWSGRV